MKTITRLSKMILLIVAVAVTSCNKDDDNNNNPVAASGNFFLSAKVNGANYSNSSYFAPTSVLSNGFLMIQSSDDSGKSIQIQIMNFNDAGTYVSGNNDVTLGYINYTTISPIKTYTSVRGNGTVVVTEVTDSYISGTFSASAPENVENATESISITDGSFKVKRQ